MAERSVKVTLTAVVADFKRQMGEAAKSTKQVGDAAQDAERRSSKLGDVAKGLGKVALTGLAVATSATVALGAAALKTGIQYNQLEQTSRAALTTLLGSTEAANAQMERLAEFARSSPFPRQVFIEAQQQMIAFGFAAKDVIPVLDAVQDAVAAAGGSAQDISEIVRVLSKVQSTGKVTAVELNQLGIRGIDAAGLIGQAFGKTADQIRDEISAGTLDAATFITTLTQQMEARFGGAAENLKQTWVGATDRVKGAFRDIGSVIAEPFVSKTGGGAAVEWANGLADAMRALEGVLGPVVQELAQQAAPAFDNVTRALEDASTAIGNMDPGRLTGELRELSPAITGLGAAGLTAAGGLTPFGKALGPKGALIAGIAGFVLSVPEARAALVDLLDALAPLVEVAADVARQLVPYLSNALIEVADMAGPAISGLEDVFGAIERGREIINPTREETRDLGDDMEAAGLRMVPIVGNFFSLWDAAKAAKEGLFGAGEEAKLTGRRTKDAGEAAEAAAGQFAGQADVLGEVASQTQAATEALGAYADAQRAAVDPFFALRQAIQQVTEAEQALEDVRADSEATAQDVADAEWALFEALTNADAAAHNSALSFEGVNQVLDDMVTRGLISAETAAALRTQIDSTREAAEDYTGPYTADLLAEIDEPAIRDAKAALDAVARARNPRYLAELDRQAEIRARNRLDAMAAPRQAPVRAQAENVGQVEGALDRLAQRRFTTIHVGYAVSGGLPAGLTRGHQGGMVTPAGIMRMHDGGTVPRFHNGAGILGRQALAPDEVPAILQVGERVLSRPQAAAFNTLVSPSAMASRPTPAASLAGGGTTRVDVRLVADPSFGSREAEFIQGMIRRGQLRLEVDRSGRVTAAGG